VVSFILRTDLVPVWRDVSSEKIFNRVRTNHVGDLVELDFLGVKNDAGECVYIVSEGVNVNLTQEKKVFGYKLKYRSNGCNCHL
jgi:hypothetical protein